MVFCCVTVVPARAQLQPPEDPEDEKQIGLWLDQGISAGFSTYKSLEVEFHERFDEGRLRKSATAQYHAGHIAGRVAAKPAHTD